MKKRGPPSRGKAARESATGRLPERRKKMAAAKDRRETPDADDQRPANQPFHHTAIGR